MPKKYQKIKKQTIDIIIAPAKNIKKRNQFDHNVPFQVVPERIVRIEILSFPIIFIEPFLVRTLIRA